MAITVDAIEYPPGSGTYVSVGTSTDYGGRFLHDNPYGGMRGQPIEQSRAGTSASFQAMNIGSRPMPITFSRNTSGAVSNTNFHANLFKYFNPEARNSAGVTTRYLRCTWHDGSTVLRMPVNVLSATVRTQEIIDVQVQATWPYLEETSAETTATVGVDTPSNSGNVDAGPLLSITSTNNPNAGYRFAITETGGIGASNVPVLLDAGSASLTEAKTYVFDQDGKSVPFTVTSGRYVWTTCSIDADDTINFYVVYDAGFSNTAKAGDLDWGEFYTSGTVNTAHSHNGFLISTNPARTGLWHPQALAFTGGGGTDWGYYSEEVATYANFILRTSYQSAKNDANGMVIVCGIPADSITGLSRVTTNHTSNVQSFVRYRQAGQANWTDAWTQTSSTTVTTTITLVDAVEIAIGVEATDTAPTDYGTLTVAGTGTPDINVNFDTGKDLTVVRTDISASVGIVDGNITNSTTGQVITFDDLMFYDASAAAEIMYLDFRPEATKRIYSKDTSNGIVLGKETAISFTDPLKGMSITPGSNTMTESITGSVTVDYRSTYG